MKEDVRDLEWCCLEGICLHFAQVASAPDLAVYLKSSGFSMGRLYEYALRNKLQFVVASVLLANPLVQLIPWSWRAFLRLAISANRQRNMGLLREADRLFGLLAAEGIRTVARKGVLLEHTVYGSNGCRWFGDIDFMVRAADKATVASVLERAGYQPGFFDEAENSIRPHDRKHLLTLALSPDHMPRFCRLDAGDPLGVVEVDFAMSFTWSGSDILVDLDEAFLAAESPLASQGMALKGFSVPYCLLDTILHFFREAYFEQSIRAGGEVPLSGFLDILRIHQKHSDLLGGGEFARFARRFQAEEPCAWVLTHLDRVLETRLTRDLGLEGKASEEYLQTWRRSGGATGTWRGTMRDRMRARRADRMTLFSA